MKRVILWVDCKPTTLPVCFYANDVSVKGWKVEYVNVEYFADDESATVDCGLSSVQMGNTPLASPTIR